MQRLECKSTYSKQSRCSLSRLQPCCTMMTCKLQDKDKYNISKADTSLAVMTWCLPCSEDMVSSFFLKMVDLKSILQPCSQLNIHYWWLASKVLKHASQACGRIMKRPNLADIIWYRLVWYTYNSCLFDIIWVGIVCIFF